MADSDTEKMAARSLSPTNPIELIDAEHETALLTQDEADIPHAKTPKSPRSVRFQEEAEAPTKPPRPLSPQQQALITLIEAFPSIDGKVVKAVLAASGGQLEPAFNALLGMSDPDFQEEQPPPRPPRPVQHERQISQDEMYARHLAEHYQTTNKGQQKPRQPRSQDQKPIAERTLRSGESSEDREYSFMNDDLPVIRENVRQGFLQTQSTVNRWINDFRKRIDGEADSDDHDIYAPPGGAPPQRQNYGASQADQLRGIRKNAETAARQNRLSTESNRYDADPRVLSDNFAELELRDEETPPPKPNRPLSNPALYRPSNAIAGMSINPPQSGPVDEVDALYRQSTPAGGNSAKGNKKWQPLTSVAPNSEVMGDAFLDDDDENDPFSLGDNSDEDKGHDINKVATERLKNAAAKKDKGKGRDTSEVTPMEEHERAGTSSVRDKDADEILKG